MKKQQLAILCGVLTTSAVVGYTTIYLPFYDQDLASKRQSVKQNQPGSRGSTSSSMWARLDQEAKKKDSS